MGTQQVAVRSFTVELMIVAWLDAKFSLSNSERTTRIYKDTINNFRRELQSAGYDLDSAEQEVALAAQGWSNREYNGRSVSSATRNQRLSILSSFYKYAVKHRMLSDNPVERIGRAKRQTKEAALPLDDSDIERLSAIDRTQPEGQRDYVLLKILLTTGRRVTEAAQLRLRDLTFRQCVTVTWQRCKGNKQMKDKLSLQTSQALLLYLHSVYGPSLLSLSPDTPVFVSFSRHNKGQAISSQTIADICLKRLGTSKVHALRHTFAVNMERAGASLSEIGARLGHENLQTTSEYMKRLHDAENKYLDKLEELYGV